ncbi:MAG: high light inducible protein [Synechococcus sp. TMED20]|nr:MAG: high light inducible protein [Synechococcus sp. TMED20]
MARQQRRSAFLCKAERFNGRIAMLAVAAAAAAELTLGHPLLILHGHS